MKLKHIIFLLVISMAGFSCGALKELATFAKCQFRMTTMENTRLAGVNIQGKKSLSDFKITDAAKLTMAIAKGALPLSFTLNVEAKNPNPVGAAIQGMDWIAYIDDVEIVRGRVNQRIEVAANNGVSNIPLQISVDLKKVINKDSKDALINFGLNLTDAGNKPTRVKLKVKPSILVSGVPITYPGYFPVKKEFGAGN